MNWKEQPLVGVLQKKKIFCKISQNSQRKNGDGVLFQLSSIPQSPALLKKESIAGAFL